MASLDLSTSTSARRFLHGLGAPLRGAAVLVRTPKLWPWAVVPVLLTIAMIVGAAVATWTWGDDLAARFVAAPTGEGWLAALGRAAWWVYQAIVHLFVFGLLAVLGWFAASVVGSPFHDLLSDAVERHVRGKGIDEPIVLRTLAADVAVGVRHTLVGLLLWLALSCPLQLLHLIPVAGEVVFLVTSTLLTAFFLAREVLDYSFSRRRYGFGTKLGLLRANLAITEGLGMGTFLVLWVPGLNLLSLPAAIVGATMVFCDLDDQGLMPPARPGAGALRGTSAEEPAADDPPAPS